MSLEMSELERIWQNIIRMRDLREDDGAESRQELLKALREAEQRGEQSGMKDSADICDACLIKHAPTDREMVAMALCAESIRAAAKAKQATPISLQIVEAGVDPNHQSDHCDDCQKKAVVDEEGHSDLIKTCSHTEYLTLCHGCYKKRGNGVR